MGTVPIRPQVLTEADLARALELAGIPPAPQRLEVVTREMNRTLALATLLDPLLVPVPPDDVPVSFTAFDPTWPTGSDGKTS